MSRSMAYAGNQAKARLGFENTIRLINNLPKNTDRDQPLAILATNQARALRLNDARKQIKKIHDIKIADTARENLSNSELLLNTMN